MIKVRIKVTKNKHWFLVLLPAILSPVSSVFSSSSVKRWQIIWWFGFLRLVRVSMTKCFWLHEMVQNTSYIWPTFYFLWCFMEKEEINFMNSAWIWKYEKIIHLLYLLEHVQQKCFCCWNTVFCWSWPVLWFRVLQLFYMYKGHNEVFIRQICKGLIAFNLFKREGSEIRIENQGTDSSFTFIL